MASQDGNSRTKRQPNARTDLSAGALAKADAGRKAAQERKAEKATQERETRAADIAQQRVAAADRKAEHSAATGMRKEQVRRDFNREGEDRKAAEQKQAAAKQEAQKQANERKAPALYAAERQKAQQARAPASQFAALRALRARSADEVREDFKRQQGELLDGQTQQFSTLSKHRARERDSFAANRDEAIRHHAGRIQEIDGREKQAADRTRKKTRQRCRTAIRLHQKRPRPAGAGAAGTCRKV